MEEKNNFKSEWKEPTLQLMLLSKEDLIRTSGPGVDVDKDPNPWGPIIWF